jgi:hypothetical protein
MNGITLSSLFEHERTSSHVPTLMEKWHAGGQSDSTTALCNSQSTSSPQEGICIGDAEICSGLPKTFAWLLN